MRLALAVVTCFCLLAGSASAATNFDIRGSWACCGAGGAAAQTWNIATLDQNSGEFTGSGFGGPYTWPMNGIMSGNQFTVTTTYNELPGYTGTFTGTMGASSKSMSGTWSDNGGKSGTWTAKLSATPPAPQAGKTVNAKAVSGTVLVKLPGATTFSDLSGLAVQLPIGTTVETTKGRIQLTAAQSLTTKKVASAAFYKGIFLIGQKKAARPIMDLGMVGGSFASCAKAGSSGASAAQKTKVRELWGSGKGLFRTSGKYSAATIRGTEWSVTDYCDGTLTKVTQGSVTVRDIGLKRNLVVNAPKSYFAKAP